jgi:glycosyltransferase involved in cell wall biosynthesis
MIDWLDAHIACERPGDEPIAYFMTHPLMSTQNRPYGRDGSLRVEHIERMLLLCNTFEVQNGARTRALNGLTSEMLDALTPELLGRLADRHGLAPKGPTPWLKSVVAGSDDHAGINPGRTWTEVDIDSDLTPADLVRAIRQRRTRAGGVHGGPVTLAHALLKLLYDGSRNRAYSTSSARPSRSAPALGHTAQQLLDLVFDGSSHRPIALLRFQARGAWIRARRRMLGEPVPPFEEVLHESMTQMLGDPDLRQRLLRAESTDDRIFIVLGTLANRLFKTYVDRARRADSGLVGTVKSLVAMLGSTAFLSLPYFVSFMQHSSDSLVARDVRKAFDLHRPPRLVLVTDTFFEVNGVAVTIRRLLRESARRGIDLTVVTATSVERGTSLDPEARRWVQEGRLKLFRAVDALDFPEYDGLEILFPPLLEMLRFLQEGGFTKMQISTPGTVGVTSLLCAKLLQIETSSTYHTSFPEYVENYTKDVALEALAWNYMTLFYHSVDEVVVPSKFIARLLHKRGLRNRKLLVLDRWTDVQRFTPAKRDPSVWLRLGAAEASTRFIYVGRIGVEKNLALLAAAFRRLAATRTDIHLTFVGDGPFRKELEASLRDLPVYFTGFLDGEALPTLLASADIMVFPSTTDTWGNAPLEAQAAGLPVIVSAVGGPRELMLDQETGLVVSGRDVAELASAMGRLCDRELRERLGVNARKFALDNDVKEPFTAILDANAYRESLKHGAHPSRAVIALPQSEGADADHWVTA